MTTETDCLTLRETLKMLDLHYHRGEVPGSRLIIVSSRKITFLKDGHVAVSCLTGATYFEANSAKEVWKKLRQRKLIT